MQAVKDVLMYRNIASFPSVKKPTQNSRETICSTSQRMCTSDDFFDTGRDSALRLRSLIVALLGSASAGPTGRKLSLGFPKSHDQSANDDKGSTKINRLRR